MRFKNLQGDFAFKALYKEYPEGREWILSKCYYFNHKDIKNAFMFNEVIWPVEVIDGEIVRVMDQEELE